MGMVVVLGSGGHTAEMIRLLESLDVCFFFFVFFLFFFVFFCFVFLFWGSFFLILFFFFFFFFRWLDILQGCMLFLLLIPSVKKR